MDVDRRKAKRLEKRYQTILQLHLRECKRLGIRIKGRYRYNTPASLKVKHRAIRLGDVNEPLTREQSEDRINILLIIVCFILSIILMAYIISIVIRKPSEPIVVMPKVHRKKVATSPPMEMIGIVNHGNLFAFGNENNTLNLPTLPRSGTIGAKIFPIFENNELWFVYSDPKKPIITFNLITKKHGTLPKNSHIFTDTHLVNSMGVRVGGYFWAIGGTDLSFTSLFSNPTINWMSGELEVEGRESSLLSMRKGQWQVGPMSPDTSLISFKPEENCVLSINSTTILFIAFKWPQMVEERYNFQIRKWTSQSGTSYADVLLLMSCALNFDKSGQQFVFMLYEDFDYELSVIKYNVQDRSQQIMKFTDCNFFQKYDGELHTFRGQLHKIELVRNSIENTTTIHLHPLKMNSNDLSCEASISEQYPMNAKDRDDQYGSAMYGVSLESFRPFSFFIRQ